MQSGFFIACCQENRPTKMTIELPVPDKRRIATLFDARLREYHQDLTLEGLTAQQYDVLRGRIKELQSLSLELALSDTESRL